jgi:transcriptional regulator with XRE-family HTH domain
MRKKRENAELKFNLQIGRKLKQLRLNKGLSQKEMAKNLEVSQRIIAAYENGNVSIPLFALMKISEFFEIPGIDYFIAKPGSFEEEVAYYGIDIGSQSPAGLHYLAEIAKNDKDIKRLNEIRIRGLNELYMSSGNEKLIKKLNEELKGFLEGASVLPMDADKISNVELKLFILDEIKEQYLFYEEHELELGPQAIVEYDKLNYILDRAYLMHHAINHKKFMIRYSKASHHSYYIGEQEPDIQEFTEDIAIKESPHKSKGLGKIIPGKTH